MKETVGLAMVVVDLVDKVDMGEARVAPGNGGYEGNSGFGYGGGGFGGQSGHGGGTGGSRDGGMGSSMGGGWSGKRTGGQETMGSMAPKRARTEMGPPGDDSWNVGSWSQ